MTLGMFRNQAVTYKHAQMFRPVIWLSIVGAIGLIIGVLLLTRPMVEGPYVDLEWFKPKASGANKGKKVIQPPHPKSRPTTGATNPPHHAAEATPPLNTTAAVPNPSNGEVPVVQTNPVSNIDPVTKPPPPAHPTGFHSKPKPAAQPITKMAATHAAIMRAKPRTKGGLSPVTVKRMLPVSPRKS